MTFTGIAMDRIQEAFVQRFSHFDLRLPDDHLRERKKGSLPYGSGGRLYYVFGEENGREYLEYYAYHRMGESHGRIWQDGTLESLPELCSMYGFDPKIPGDRERKEAAMQKRYRETLDDLIARGLFDDEPVPGSLAINSYLVLHGANDDDRDPYNLDRFVQAQRPIYEQALSELRASRKRSHWMWYIFPQVAGLGGSETSRNYAIRSLAEAEAYLQHPVLGPRLVECAEAVLAVDGRSALEIFGSPDDRKLRSCATLFALVSPPGSVFHRLLDRYFGGEPDARTSALLGLNGRRGH